MATACTPEVAESPLLSLQRLHRAVEAGDTATTLAYVDLDAIAARLLSDVLASARDSFPGTFPDTVTTESRARRDSIKQQWRDAFRLDLGLPPGTPGGAASPGSPSGEPPDRDLKEGSITAEAEIVGDGAVRYRGDTAVVDRLVRYARLDTTVTLQLALVPVENRHWRLVAVPNVLAMVQALEARRTAVLERVNAPWRDSIRGRIVVTQVRITREPLEEWDRYAAHARVTVQNRGPPSVTLVGAQLVGPRIALDDSLGSLLREPITVLPGQAVVLRWERPLTGDPLGPYDVVARPDSYTVELTAIETHEIVPRRFKLYRTWEEYVTDTPLLARPSGVLASQSRRGAAELAAATVRREY